MINTLKYSFRNIIRAKRRTIPILCVVVVVSFVIVLIGGLYNYMFEAVYNDQVNTMGDCYVTIKRVGDPDTINHIETAINSINGIENYVCRGKISGVVGYNDKSSIFSGELFNQDKEKVFYKDKDTDIVMGKLLSDILGINKGQEFSGFSSEYSFSAILDKIVDKASEEENLYYISLPFESIGAQNELEVATSIHFHTADNNTTEELRKFFSDKNLYEFHTAEESGGYFSSVKTIFENNLLFIIIALCLTMFFSLSIFFSLLISHRMKEYGIRKSLGEGDKNIMLEELIEGLIICLVGVVLGIVLSEIVGAIINLLGGIIIPPLPTLNTSILINYSSSIKYPFIVLCLCVPVSIIASLYSGNIIRKKSIKECLDL